MPPSRYYGGTLKLGGGDLEPTRTLLERAHGRFRSRSTALSFSTEFGAESSPQNACWKAIAGWLEEVEQPTEDAENSVDIRLTF